MSELEFIVLNFASPLLYLLRENGVIVPPIAFWFAWIFFALFWAGVILDVMSDD